MVRYFLAGSLYVFSLIFLSACSEDDKLVEVVTLLETPTIVIEQTTLNLQDPSLNIGISLTSPIVVSFQSEIDITTASAAVRLRPINGEEIPVTLSFLESNTSISVAHQELVSNQAYIIEVDDNLTGAT